MNDIPDWAGKRACELLNEGTYVSEWRWPRDNKLGPVITVAKLVMQYEQPPIDPLYEALKAVVEMGRYDTREQAALLRAELAERNLEIVECTK